MNHIEKEKQSYFQTTRGSERLLRCAKNIFGDEMVLQAWVQTHWNPGQETTKERDDRLTYNENQITQYKSNRFVYPDQTIYLKLNNGRIIYFTNTEAGAIGFLEPH